MSKIICVDFDNTVCDSKFPNEGPPINGAKEALEELKRDGWEIHILSCRTSPSVYKYPIDRIEQVRKMEQFLKENNIPFDKVLNMDKPIAYCYIDDRAVAFRGDWKQAIIDVKKLNG